MSLLNNLVNPSVDKSPMSQLIVTNIQLYLSNIWASKYFEILLHSFRNFEVLLRDLLLTNTVWKIHPMSQLTVTNIQLYLSNLLFQLLIKVLFCLISNFLCL